jgi:hypothetical protein
LTHKYLYPILIQAKSELLPIHIVVGIGCISIKKETQMRKLLIIFVVAGLMGFLPSGYAFAEGEDGGPAFMKLKHALQQKGISEKDINLAQKPINNMLKQGATEEDIEKVVSNLSEKGMKGRNLRNSLISMNDLINNGEDPKNAGNIVSRAAHEAHAQGLKGRDLANRVHEAIQQRKQERNRLKQEKKEQKKEQKQWKIKRGRKGKRK